MGIGLGGGNYGNGKKMHFNTPKDAIEAGIAYVTEDRKGNRLILIQDVKQKYKPRKFTRISEKWCCG